MSQLSDAEVDASLFALGIGSDARGVRVLLLGYGPPYNTVVDRLRTFGAVVDGPENAEEDNESGSYDFVVCLHTELSFDFVVRWLKPEGRYMMLLDGVGSADAGVTITDVAALGVSAVRILGYKARRQVDSQEGSQGDSQ